MRSIETHFLSYKPQTPLYSQRRFLCETLRASNGFSLSLMRMLRTDSRLSGTLDV